VTKSTVIEVQNLHYRYPGADRLAVEDVSFQVKSGEVFGLLGPSGAGKSTIQKVLTRQHRNIASGSVSVLGRSVQSWGQNFYEVIGVGFELPNHYLRLTARENLEFFRSLYTSAGKPIDELLEMVGLEKAADTRVAEFSKGMMMRLNFVRALMHDPHLIFLDEPTSGLDPVNARNVKQIMRRLQEAGKTIVLTTHNMSDVDELCDRVGFMVGGQMRALDQVAALKARFGERSLRVEFEGPGGVDSQSFPLDKLAENENFTNLLKTSSIRTMHSQEASLDDVFSRVTGASLGAGE
jgi:fluoroquinolone transport system ATP-binding protein